MILNWLFAFVGIFFPYHSKITTFAIELGNSENMRKNLRTHQSEFRREDSARESPTGTTPPGASFPLRPSRGPPLPIACSSRQLLLGESGHFLTNSRAPSCGRVSAGHNSSAVFLGSHAALQTAEGLPAPSRPSSLGAPLSSGLLSHA